MRASAEGRAGRGAEAAAGALTVGTAGHVDHGKTALVGALTGTDTDRLAEEKARGLSIELGYAALRAPGFGPLSVVDVPGHERFVRTMVAGATGIDLYLMAVAADDGVMPQTREHAAVLAALGVERGVVAITKCDLAAPERAAAQAAELLPGAEVVACSARTGAGVDDVARALGRLAARAGARRRRADGPALLHVDRAFTVHGAGTVVTGTLWSGAVARGDELRLLATDRRPGGSARRAAMGGRGGGAPQRRSRAGRGAARATGPPAVAERWARVRGVQVHDRAVERAGAGRRVAVNLAGVSLREVTRGDVLVGSESTLAPTLVVDAELELRDARHGARAMVHHGTRAVAARLAELGGGLWQLRLEAPLVAGAGDRLVVRSIAPPDTLGGGRVLDPCARRHGRGAAPMAHLERLRRGEPQPRAEGDGAGAAGRPPAPGRDAGAARPRAHTGRAARGAGAPTRDGGATAAAPAREGLDGAALALAERLRAAGHEPPSAAQLGAAAAHLPALVRAGVAVRVGRDRYAHRDALAAVAERVAAIASAEGAVTLARLRDELGTSRRFAQALLEHLDAARVTLRLADDRRVLRRAGRRSSAGGD